MSRQLHPYTRIAVLIIGGASITLAHRWLSLAAMEIIILFFVLSAGLGKMLLRFLFFAILPMSLMFVGFHLVFPTIKGSAIGTDLFKVEQLFGYTLLLQLALVIPLKDVHQTFRTWGLRRAALITAVSSYFVWNDVVQRSERILLARLSQGYVTKRAFWTKAKQVPFVIVPLVIGVMRTAAERADSWEQKNMLERFDTVELPGLAYSKGYNLSLIGLTILGLAASLW